MNHSVNFQPPVTSFTEEIGCKQAKDKKHKKLHNYYSKPNFRLTKEGRRDSRVMWQVSRQENCIEFCYGET